MCFGDENKIKVNSFFLKINIFFLERSNNLLTTLDTGHIGGKYDKRTVNGHTLNS